MTDYDLVSPSETGTWRAFHDIRRTVLFEARGEFGVYDENRPDDHAPGNHPKLLRFRGEPIGVVRIDIDGATALLRRVAVRSDVQRLGHGRVLLSLVEDFARHNGCRTLASHVAVDAVGFYEKCGFAIQRTEPHAVVMSKPVTRCDSSALPS
jgi:GNAT superfamily N-acetyltransferase